MIPDSFYKINSDAKYNSVGGVGREEKRLRADNLADKKKDFARILSNKEKGDGEEENEKLIKGEEAAIGEASDQEGVLHKNPMAKKGFPALLDTATNQTETIAKDSKVAPRLGKEKLAAPPEQPYSEPYVESVQEDTPFAVPGIAKNEKGPVKEDMAGLTDSPAMLFSRMAKESGSPIKHMPLQKLKLSEFIPKKGELEIVEKDVEHGFSLIPVKQSDQDIALINLAVVSLSTSDLIVDATKLRPVVKIPPFIMALVEKISNEIKDDVTKTTITLRNAGIFSGVEVTITAFKTARSEINIQFANMSGEAKSLLEINLDALKQALDNKGHTVHMIIATTLKEEPIASAAPLSKEKDETKEDGQNQKKKQDKDEEES